jgi:hypothetical protein
VSWFGEEFCSLKSPFVVEDAFFDTGKSFDHIFHMLYCRLARMLKPQRERTPLWAQAFEDCMAGEMRHAWPFDHLRALWRAYPDVPKFAFLNSIAAHTYVDDLARMSAALEAVDAVLHNFTSGLFSSSTSRSGGPTVLLLHGDHGLQAGPSSIEWSAQVEQRSPWAVLVMPRAVLPAGNVTALLANQKRLVTAFDLHKTLLGILARAGGEPHAAPTWAYDLSMEVVPENRTCDEARVPELYCACAQKLSPPAFGICHGDQHGEGPMFCNRTAA